jgi:hypothetical protein
MLFKIEIEKIILGITPYNYYNTPIIAVEIDACLKSCTSFLFLGRP